MNKQISRILQVKTGALITALLLMCLFSTRTLAQIPSYIDTAGLIGWYSFTGNANDSSGNGNNGTVYGATLTTDRFGHANSAYSYNGSSDYIQVVYPVSLNTQTYSGICISAWCKFNVLPGTEPETIIRMVDSMPSNQKQFSLTYDEVLYKFESCNGVNGYACYDLINSIDTPIVGVWYHVVLNSDFTLHQTSFYVNSVLQATSSDTIIKPFIKFLNIGQFVGGAGWWMNGSIDDIGVWNHALTQCEISQLYLSSINSGIINQPTNDTVLTGGTATYIITDTNSSATYQWQQNSGTGFTNLSNAGPYSGVTTKILTINPVTAGMNNYLYRCIVDTGLCADTSTAANLIVNASTGIINLLKEQITISPNPATNVITITSPIAIEKIEITNMIGQKIISQRPNMSSINLNIQNLVSGMYIIKLNDNCIKRFVKE